MGQDGGGNWSGSMAGVDVDGAERLALALLARAYRDAAGSGPRAQEAHGWLLSVPGRRLARLLGYDWTVPSRERLRRLAAHRWTE